MRRMSERGRRWGQVGRGRCPDQRGWFGPRAKTRREVAEAWEEPGVSGEGSHLGGAPPDTALSTSLFIWSLTTVLGHGGLVSPSHPHEECHRLHPGLPSPNTVRRAHGPRAPSLLLTGRQAPESPSQEGASRRQPVAGSILPAPRMSRASLSVSPCLLCNVP